MQGKCNISILKYIAIVVIISYIIFSCKEHESINILVLSNNINKTHQINLSEIAKNIYPIRLEATNESLIGNWHIQNRVYLFNNYLIILDGHIKQVLVFKSNGEFLRSIGKRGEGPGEFTTINHLTVSPNNELIYVLSNKKVICYNFNGKFIKETYFDGNPEYIECIDDNFFLLSTFMNEDPDKKNINSKTMLYKLNTNLQVTDSLFVNEKSINKYVGISSTNKDYITINNNSLYIYLPSFLPKNYIISKEMIGDTLYQIQSGKIIPQIAIINTNDKNMPYLHRLYESTRFVIGFYILPNSYLLYDKQTKKSFYIEDGFIDDFHSGNKIRIRPLNLSTDKFYYFDLSEHDDRYESNPILYIGELKK